MPRNTRNFPRIVQEPQRRRYQPRAWIGIEPPPRPVIRARGRGKLLAAFGVCLALYACNQDYQRTPVAPALPSEPAPPDAVPEPVVHVAMVSEPPRDTIELDPSQIFPEARLGWDGDLLAHHLEILSGDRSVVVTALGPKEILAAVVDHKGIVTGHAIGAVHDEYGELVSCGTLRGPMEGSEAISIWGLGRAIGGPWQVFEGRWDPSESSMGVRELALPAGWVVRDAGPRPCRAWSRAGSTAIALVLDTPGGIGVVQYSAEGSEPAAYAALAATVAVEPALSVAEGAVKAWVGVRVISDDGTPYLLAAAQVGASGRLELSEVAREPGRHVSGLVDVRNDAPGLWIARPDGETIGQYARGHLVWRPVAGQEERAGEVLMRAWAPPLSALETSAGRFIVAQPRAAQSLSERIAVVMEPERPDPPVWGSERRREVAVAVWDPEGAWLVAAALRDLGATQSEDATLRSRLELSWTELSAR